MHVLFGLLRCGEIVVPFNAAFDASTHVAPGDVHVRVDIMSSPQYIQVHIKASKIDMFQLCVFGRTQRDVCPVAAVVACLHSAPGPNSCAILSIC